MPRLVTLLVVLVATIAGAAEPPHGASTVYSAARTRAIDQVVASAQSPDPFLRANAIEAAQSLPDRIVPMVQLAIQDPSPVVRFAALTAAGRLKLRGLSRAIRPLTVNDPSDSVRAAALFALRAGGEKVDLSPMAEYLTGPDADTRGNVALLLGLLGDKSAVPMLKELTKVEMPRASAEKAAKFRIQVAEAVVRLGDDGSLTALRAGAYSQFDEVRVLS